MTRPLSTFHILQRLGVVYIFRHGFTCLHCGLQVSDINIHAAVLHLAANSDNHPDIVTLTSYK